MKLKELIKEVQIDDVKRLYTQETKFKEFITRSAKEYDVDRRYIDTYAEITDAFNYLVWIEIFHAENPDMMPDEEYEKEKNNYFKILDKYSRRY